MPRHLRAACACAQPQLVDVLSAICACAAAGTPTAPSWSAGAVDGTARRVRRPGRPRAAARPPQHRRTRCAASAACLIAGVTPRDDRRGAGDLPRPAASPGGDRPRRPHALHQRQQGDQRRQRSEGAGRVPRRHLLDHRRQAQGGRHRKPDRLFPAHRQGLSDRPGDGGIRSHARRQGRRSSAAARSTRRSPQRRAMRRRAAARAGGAAVAGLRLLRPVQEFRGPRRSIPRNRRGAARHRAGRRGPEPGRGT